MNKFVINSFFLVTSLIYPNEIGIQSKIFTQNKNQENKIIEDELSPTEKLVLKYSKEHDIDPELVFAVIEAESKGKHKSKSYKGAIGIMQLMPTTAKWLNVNPYILEENIKGGTLYLAKQLKKYKDTKLALAAYNAGPGNVDKYGRTVPPFKETLKYINKICSQYECERA